MFGSCDICNIKFNTQDEANKHYLEYHRGEMNCKDCGKSFSSTEELKKHKTSEHHK